MMKQKKQFLETENEITCPIAMEEFENEIYNDTETHSPCLYTINNKI